MYVTVRHFIRDAYMFHHRCCGIVDSPFLSLPRSHSSRRPACLVSSHPLPLHGACAHSHTHARVDRALGAGGVCFMAEGAIPLRARIAESWHVRPISM